MRDKLKDMDYYSACIEYEIARIKRFNQALQTVDTNNLTGVRNANIYLSNFHRNLFKLKYSAGYSISEIFDDYINWIAHYKLICSENDSFYDWVDMFSIGVLFSKNRERFLPSLTEILKKSKISDGLILFFYNYLNCSHYTFTESNTSYFKTLFFAEDKQSVIVQLLTDWYSVHKDAYWYDSHKSQNDTYCGYWCFEVPALLKIFRIDDSFCSNADYYPNDFV